MTSFLYSIVPFLLLIHSVYSDHLTKAQIKETLDLHNMVRAQMTASNMERMASNWADKCSWPPAHHMEGKYRGDIGQNMDNQPSYNPFNMTAAILSWTDEIDYMDMKKFTCKEEFVKQRKECGHFTQAVWSWSNTVGCGYRRCYNPNRNFYVCNYHPAGNEGGSKPFKYGPACSHCRSGHGWCDKQGLCRNDCPHAGSANCQCKQVCLNGGTLDPRQCECLCAAGYQGVNCERKCVDVSPNCGHHMVVRGWCKGHSSWFMDNCPLTCGYCKKGARQGY